MVALAFVIFLRRNVIPQASLVRFVKKTSMTAYQNRATMVCVKMASPPSPVSAMLDTQAPSVISRYRSATAIPVRTEDAALTSSMPTSATAHREPQVYTTLISCSKTSLTCLSSWYSPTHVSSEPHRRGFQPLPLPK